MKSMGAPDYVYKPWTEERRVAARARMKAIVAGRRPEQKLRNLIEQVERHAYAFGYQDGLNSAIDALNARIEREVKKKRPRRKT